MSCGKGTGGRIVRPAKLVISCLLGGLVLASCAEYPPRPAVSLAPAAGPSDDEGAVDCLLPGQIRKLGTRLTTLTPHRMVRTSPTDCEIRGGEPLV